MKLREYLPSKDFDNIKSWIDDERTHAMWCAGRFEYPLEKENFEAVLEDMHSKWGDTPFMMYQRENSFRHSRWGMNRWPSAFRFAVSSCSFIFSFVVIRALAFYIFFHCFK